MKYSNDWISNNGSENNFSSNSNSNSNSNMNNNNRNTLKNQARKMGVRLTKNVGGKRVTKTNCELRYNISRARSKNMNNLVKNVKKRGDVPNKLVNMLRNNDPEKSMLALRLAILGRRARK